MNHQDILLLKLRNAMAQKEWITAHANQQLDQFNGWSHDFSEDQANNQIVIDKLIAEIEKVAE